MSYDLLLSEPIEAPFALSNLSLTSAALAANVPLQSLLSALNHCPESDHICVVRAKLKEYPLL